MLAKSEPVRLRVAHTIADELNARAAAKGWAVKCDAALLCEHPKLAAIRDLWLASSSARLPARAHFTARSLKQHLPNLCILDIHQAEDGRLRYKHRYVGTEVVHRFGELTGRYVDDFIPAELLPKTLTYFDAVANAGIALRVVTNFEMSAVSYVQGEGLLLPLADDGTKVNMLMSVSYFRNKVPIEHSPG